MHKFAIKIASGQNSVNPYWGVKFTLLILGILVGILCVLIGVLVVLIGVFGVLVGVLSALVGIFVLLVGIPGI